MTQKKLRPPIAVRPETRFGLLLGEADDLARFLCRRDVAAMPLRDLHHALDQDGIVLRDSRSHCLTGFITLTFHTQFFGR
jgi:hypothetical protein